MPYDRRLDPKTRDYMDDGSGGWKTTLSASSKIHHQIFDKYNHWVGRPEQGSLWFTLAHEKRSASTKRRVLEVFKLALQPLVSEGLIDDVHIELTEDARGRLAVAASAHDAQYGEPIDLSDYAPFKP